MKTIILTILVLILACGKTKPKVAEVPDIDRLKDKAAFYLSHGSIDENGWVKDTKCDGLLFNSIYSIGGGNPDILLASDKPGHWYRHWQKDCFPGGSASSISRDMFAGLYLWIYHNKRLDLISDIINYGEKHTNDIGGWVMGEGDKFAISIRSSGQTMSYLLRRSLGGADHGKAHLLIPRFPVKGYEDHLQMLDILLASLVNGGISDLDLQAAKDSAAREPRNALFQAIVHKYTDGDQTAAVKVLLDESLFPSDRMPESRDRCEMYLWQRDDNDNWRPCSQGGKIFSAVDFLIAKAVILNEI